MVLLAMASEQTYRQDQDTRTVTLRECPYCNETVQSRGLYAHVMNSQDEDHGEYRSVPENFNPREAAIVGENEVEAEEDERPEVDNWLYLCTLCGNLLKGEMGYKVHLAKVAGDDLHPQEVDIDDDHYVRIPADEDYEPTIPEDRLEEITEEQVGQVEQDDDDGEADTVTRRGQEAEQRGAVPISELEALVAKFRGSGNAYEDAEEEVEQVIERHRE